MNWRCLCDVDAGPLIAWLEEGDRLPPMANPVKPQRLWTLPDGLARPVLSVVLPHFSGAWADAICLSRMLPGQSHPMHVDIQRPDWITRIHVPLRTNPGAWLAFEDAPGRVHFAVGKAYTFDTLARHAFGNDGETERVHLLFDVRRGGPREMTVKWDSPEWKVAEAGA